MAYTALPVGQLATLCAQIRAAANEASYTNKYTDSKLYPLIRANYSELMREIYRLSPSKPICTFSFDAAPGTDTVILPSNVSTVERIFNRNTDTNLPQQLIWSRSHDHTMGPGFRLEGNLLRWLPKLQGVTVPLIMEYTPNGEVDIATGSIAGNTSGNSATTLVLDSTPDEGYFERRLTAFVGNWVRLIGAASNPSGYSFVPVSERLVSSYDGTVPKVTVENAFDWNPTSVGASLVTYEIVPTNFAAVIPLLAFRTAYQIHNIEGNMKRAALLKEEYQAKMRDVRLAISSLNPRDDRWEHDTYNLQDLWVAI